MLGIELWIWNIVVFIYFTLKSFLLSKLHGNANTKTSPLVSIAMVLGGLLINTVLIANYNRYLDMGYVKGSIQLPPFTILFIIADFISSSGLILFFTIRLGPAIFKAPNVRIFMDVLRLFLIYFVFEIVITDFYLKESDKHMNFNYQCFKDQIVVDLAVYYYQKGDIPSKLEDFTKYRVNPENNSPLIYKPNGPLSTTVTDEKGNKILEGYKDLMGMASYKENPTIFFSDISVTNKALCQGSVKIPLEYNKDSRVN